MKATTMERSFFGAGVMCLIFLAAPANAAVKFFFDRASFEAAMPGLATEDFEAANIGPGQGASYDFGWLDSFSDNQYFSPGSVLPGFVFFGDALFVGGDGFRGNPTKHVGSGGGGSGNISFMFTTTVFAVGVDLRGFEGAPGRWNIWVYGPDGSIPFGGSTYAYSDSQPCFFSSLPCGFIGVLSTERIGLLGLQAGAGFFGAPTVGVVDNLSFGSPVPEPSTMLLLGSGLLGITRLRRLEARE